MATRKSEERISTQENSPGKDTNNRHSLPTFPSTDDLSHFI